MSVPVSVVIPSALRPSPSGELWLERAVRSVLNQTCCQPPEIIVGLDPGESLPSDCEAARFVRVVNGEVPGHQAACNAAVAQAASELVAFLEDDDTWTCEHLETMLTVMEQAGADFMSCSQEAVTPDGRTLGPFHFPTASSWLLKKSLWEKIGGFDTSFKIHHDNRFLNQLNEEKANRLHFVPDNCNRHHDWLTHLARFTPVIRRDGLDHFTVKRTIHENSIMSGCDKDAAKAKQSEEEYERLRKMHGTIGW